MISRFFLQRPVFAWVIAIGMMVAGLLAIYNLPVQQYPSIAPPAIAVTAIYPGASAETVENTLTQVIEDYMTGLEGMIYMSSSSDAAGQCRVELTFKPGTDPDIAWAKVQNKVQLAMASLPVVVQQMGVQVMKSTRNFALIIGLVSEDASMDAYDLRDYASSVIQRVIARIPGVGEVMAFGGSYAMRIWLDLDKLTGYQLTIEDVVHALRAYNVEVSAGQFGGGPAAPGQRLNAAIIVQNMLTTPEEFEAIPVRIKSDGSVIRIKDIGRAELGTEVYDIEAFHNKRPTAALAVRLEPGANALTTVNAIKRKLRELEPYFPHGLKIVYPFDTTPFTRVAIEEVVKALLEAILLVFIVMWLFLGTMRATLVPTITVPVVILGTFAVIWLLGFSINMLTMFAMVLAIGLLVDDAIVVVENVERIMSEEGLSPRDAAAKSMDQIAPALVGIGLVLSAVFLPSAFFGGSTGVIYRQFAATVAASMLLSVVVALVLAPVLCAQLLKPVARGHVAAEQSFKLFRPFLVGFTNVFFKARDLYVAWVTRVLNRWVRYLVVYVLIVAGLWLLFGALPRAYLPDEDQGILMCQVIMPPNATLEQTRSVAEKVSDYFLQHEGQAIESVMPIVGMSFAGRGQNQGMVFIKLKDWKERRHARFRAQAIAARATAYLMQMREAMVFVYMPPPIVELGNATGFDMQLLDLGGVGHQKLMEAKNALLQMAAQDPRLMQVRMNGQDDVAQYRVDVDWEKTGALMLPISSVHNAISAAIGSAYVNNFVKAGRVKRVFVQADAPYRMAPKNLEKIYVRNAAGEMVPFSAFAKGRWDFGSPLLQRYNGFPAVNIWGGPAPGYGTTDAMKAIEELARKLPEGIGHDWTGLSYQERLAHGQAALLYAFSVLVIFLCLAALYESWTIPVAVLLVLPLGLIGGTLSNFVRGLFNDVYFQIGLLTTMGLTAKNAILIVQFAKEAMEKEGRGLFEATVQGARLRFRPIMMTSLAFGFGVLPLALHKGAASGAMNAIGTCVIGGMITGTLLAILFTPLFYVLIQKKFGRSGLQPVAAPVPNA
ncbi:MAG: efflux RND transporter permease subunit [Verrucomicrobiales bacterium]|nr:efflux RND transporter permease subunit [Verrucomicrobiales bacterium]